LIVSNRLSNFDLTNQLKTNQMKNLTSKQIETIKGLQPWTNTRFHGNRKQLSGVQVSEIKTIIEKKVKRQLNKCSSESQTPIQLTLNIIKSAQSSKGTNYFKIMIEGNTGIYLAHPEYKHQDYNKSRLFDKTPQNLKLMDLFNKIVSK